MKRNLLLIKTLVFVFAMSVEAQDFSWEHGSNTTNKNGAYGTMGVPNATTCPGARTGAATWRDNAGNLWLFSGYGLGAFGTTAGPLNDLWKYTPGTKQWTWVRGSMSTGPSYGHPAIFGTQGVASASNYPGALTMACTWTDNSGNLWMFGGADHGANNFFDHMNHLWRYNIATNQWTWMSGVSSGPNYGVYGNLAQPDPSNSPGGRNSAACWKDNSGNFWVFGGYGRAENTIGLLNDLWRYQPSTNMWTWMSGTKYEDEFADYGTINVPNASNIPGGRFRCTAWSDLQGNLWLFGGNGLAEWSLTGPTNLCDVWVFTMSTQLWTWKKGPKTGDPGVYGTKGTGAAANNPGARNTALGWKDTKGNLWLFGGRGYAENYNTQLLNDLWRYEIISNQWVWMEGSKLQNQNGTYGSLGVPNPSNIPGSREFHVGWTDVSGNIWLFGGSGRAASSTSNLFLNDLWKYQVCYVPTAPANMTSPQKLVVCENDSTELTAITSGTVSWYATPAGGLPLYTGGTYTTPALNLTTTFYAQTNGCVPSASRTGITVTVAVCSSLEETALVNSGSFNVYPNPAKGVLQIESKKELCLKIYNSLGQLIKTIESTISGAPFSLELPPGAYIFEAIGANGIERKKVIIE